MTDDDYEPVALCLHITGYFQQGATGTISAECLECGWVSVTAPSRMPSRCRGFGMKAAASVPAVFTDLTKYETPPHPLGEG